MLEQLAATLGNTIAEFFVEPAQGEPAPLRGLSWSLDRKVAEEFATRHCDCEVPERVLATARIRRDGTFMFLNERQEQEVVVDPRRLRSLQAAALS